LFDPRQARALLLRCCVDRRTSAEPAAVRRGPECL